MLFHVTWEFIDRSEDGIRRSLAVFSNGSRRPERSSRASMASRTAAGGVALIEADSAATISRTTAPWAPWLRFAMTAIVPIEESSAIAGQAITYRDSVA